jgi:hypothetical protein
VAKFFVLIRMRVFSHLGLLAMGLAAVVAACASSGKNPGGFTGSSGGGSGGSSGFGGSGSSSGFGSSGSSSGGTLPPSTCTSSAPCTDFSTVTGTTCTGSDCVFVDTSGPTTVPSNPSSLFSNPSTSGGPCLVEPQDGTMFPNGWTRARISWAPASSSQNVFEVRLHSDSEDHDLVVYTSNTNLTLPASLWQALSTNLVGPSVVVTVTASSASGGNAASSQTAAFTISPVPALGALIYWTSSSFDTTGANAATTTELKGFHVGDEGTTVALKSTQVQQPVVAGPVDGGNITSGKVGVFCIGCHTATPDGNYVAFTAQWPWPNALANVNSSADAGSVVGAPPPWLTGGAAANLSPLIGPASASGTTFYAPPIVNQVMLGVQTFSGLHYATGDRKVISALGAAQNSTSNTAANTDTGVISQLAWFDLEWNGTPGTSGFATAPCGTNPEPPASCFPQSASNGGWGIIARNGDSQSAGAPSWSHTTDVIAYTSTAGGTKDGRLDQPFSGTSGDIFTVPYNGGKGGTASPLPGASDPNFNEYYPAWAPDDQLIAFNRTAAQYSMYNQPQAEVDVVGPNPVACDGTTSAQCRLKANDPVACTGGKSPGVQNTWPKWAPLPNVASGGTAANVAADGKLYYYVTFSSTRPTACTLTAPGMAAAGAVNTLCTASQSQAAAGFAQLYVTPVVVDPNNNNAITTYPAIYMWNQDAALNNLIPSWDYFPIAAGTTQPLQ